LAGGGGVVKGSTTSSNLTRKIGSARTVNKRGDRKEKGSQQGGNGHEPQICEESSDCRKETGEYDEGEGGNRVSSNNADMGLLNANV